MRVFIVDDSQEMVRLLLHYFERKNYNVVGYAYDGKTALEKAEYLDFDVLIIDYMLGDINGYEIARKISERKNVRIIIITSDGEFQCTEFPVVRKPFSWSDFDAILKRYENQQSEFQASGIP